MIYSTNIFLSKTFLGHVRFFTALTTSPMSAERSPRIRLRKMTIQIVPLDMQMRKSRKHVAKGSDDDPLSGSFILISGARELLRLLLSQPRGVAPHMQHLCWLAHVWWRDNCEQLLAFSLLPETGGGGEGATCLPRKFFACILPSLAHSLYRVWVRRQLRCLARSHPKTLALSTWVQPIRSFPISFSPNVPS
jgi:hypothetical protein